MKSQFVAITAVIFYIISMFLPGIYYFANNPKLGFCSSAMQDDYSCIKFDNGYNCSKIKPDKPIDPKAMTKQDIESYCGQDWNTPVSQAYYGYTILLLGWAGIFVFNFAWYGNLIMVYILLRFHVENPRNILIASIIAFLLGLNAFTLRNLPNLDAHGPAIHHLGIGYYVWMLSIILLICSSYKKFRENNIPIKLTN